MTSDVEHRTVSIAGRAFSLKLCGAGVQSAIIPALAHLPPEGSVEGIQTSWMAVEEDDLWDTRELGATGTYRLRDGSVAFINRNPPAFEIYRPEAGIELRAAPASLSAGDIRAHPACCALGASLSGPTAQVVHAGAVSHEGKAALIVGPAGAGKSTTALACAMAGLDFLGDDVVFIEMTDRKGSATPQVHSMYSTAKLNADSARALGTETWPSLGVTHKKKSVHSLHNRLPVIQTARVVALIVLAPAITGRPQPEPIRRAMVPAAIASTALPLCWGIGDNATWLSMVATLARTLPAYSLPLCRDFGAMALTVRDLIARSMDRPNVSRAIM